MVMLKYMTNRSRISIIVGLIQVTKSITFYKATSKKVSTNDCANDRQLEIATVWEAMLCTVRNMAAQTVVIPLSQSLGGMVGIGNHRFAVENEHICYSSTYSILRHVSFFTYKRNTCVKIEAQYEG